MAVGGKPHVLEKAGRDLEETVNKEPGLPQLTPIPERTPLAGDLAGAHIEKVAAANKFVENKDNGIRTLGVGLVEIAKNIDEVDTRGRAAIDALFPKSAPTAVGGQ